jgi:hypothetical protein
MKTNFEFLSENETIRLYHNTNYENFQKILDSGIDPNKNRTNERPGGEGNVTWFTTENGEGYGGYTLIVDFDKSEVEKYRVNRSEYTIPFYIPPERIIVGDVPIVGGYRTSTILHQIEQYGLDKVKHAYHIDDPDWNADRWFLHPHGTMIGSNWKLYIEPNL